MRKQVKSSSYPRPAKGREVREKLKDHGQWAGNPLQVQEKVKPTEAEPVRMHAKLAGC